MRVAFFTDTYLPNVDGVVKSITLLKDFLELNSYDVVVFAPSPTGEDYEEENVIFFKSITFFPYPNYKVAFPVLRKIKEYGPFDVIHNHGIAFTSLYARYMSRFAKGITTFHTNVAYAVHYITPTLFESTMEKITWLYLKWLYSGFKYVSVPTPYAKSIVEKNGISPTHIIPNPIEADRYVKIKRKPYKKPTILHVGRVVKEKRLERIFNVIDGTDIRLIIAGSGPALDYYKSMADSIDADIDFLGFVSDEKLLNLYSRANAFVFASDFDTQGLVVAEALASGMPVLSFPDTPAVSVAEQLGTLFYDKKTFIEAFNRAINIKPDVCRSIGKLFDINIVGRKWIDLYVRE